jgi:histidine decarboxylase
MTAARSDSAAADLRHLFTLDDADTRARGEANANGPAAPHVKQAFLALRERHDRRRWYYLGFPVAHDTDFPHTYGLLAGRLINNISTAAHWPPGGQHAMEAETAVLGWLGGLFNIAADELWGHITTGGTAGNRAGIRAGRRRHPNAVVVHSSAAHYSIPTAAQDLRIPAASVDALPDGLMDLDQLDITIARLRSEDPDVAVIVVATYGTTVTEASDDLPGIHAVLDRHNISSRYVHLDAALAGIPLALDGQGRFDLADSMSVSGYKFLAVPDACGVVIGRGRSHHGEPIPYTRTLNVTETGVRSGLHAAFLYEAIAQHGEHGLRRRAHASRDLADYTIKQLADIGVTAWRNPDAYFTVVLPTPPSQVLDRWILANTDTGTSHIICVPGVTTEQVDAFVRDMAVAVPPRPARRRLPRQRPSSEPVAMPTG